MVWLWKQVLFISAMVILLIHHVSGTERFPDTLLLTAETLGYHIKMILFLLSCISFLCSWSHQSTKQNLFQVIERSERDERRWSVTVAHSIKCIFEISIKRKWRDGVWQWWSLLKCCWIINYFEEQACVSFLYWVLCSVNF